MSALATSASTELLAVDLRDEPDLARARHLACALATHLGFERIEAIRLATTTALVARRLLRIAEVARVAFRLARENDSDVLHLTADSARPPVGVDRGAFAQLSSADALGGFGPPVERTTAQLTPQGLRLRHTVALPACALEPLAAIAARVATLLRDDARAHSQSAAVEQDLTSAELLAALDASRAEIDHLHGELDDTNRGVVALYAELDDRAREIQRVLDLKSRFLSNVTHEFRTPLNSIIGLSRMLLQRIDGPLTAEQEKQARFIDRAARDLTALVDDLLDLAKADAGKTELHPTTFSIDELFSTLRGMLRPLTDHVAGVNLVFTAPQPPLSIHADESKLSQIFRNLVSNALKYTPSGEVAVSAHAEGPRIVFRVADTGIGIAPEHHESIFEEFYQVLHPLQKKTKGTGLGLALCRRFVGLMGGSITVQSTPGVGTTFIVDLPASQSPAPAAVARAVAETANLVAHATNFTFTGPLAHSATPPAVLHETNLAPSETRP